MKNSVLIKNSIFSTGKVNPEDVLYFDQIETGYHSVAASKNKLGASWSRTQSYVGEHFMLLAGEFSTGTERMVYTQQQGYIKFQFRLSGNNAVMLDGLGELTVDRPQLLITAGPEDMTKADWLAKGVRYSHVSLCVKPSFFSNHLGLDSEVLPEPLRGLLSGVANQHTAHSSLINTDLQAALIALFNTSCSRAVLACYYEAKAVEIMCLLISQFQQSGPTSKSPGLASTVKANRLYDIREMLMLNYAQPVTLEQASKAAGVSKTALTTGFRELFGMSVYDFILQQRMYKAMELIKASEYSVAQIAEAVGYKQACNFSTAFRDYYGCTPNALRTRPEVSL